MAILRKHKEKMENFKFDKTAKYDKLLVLKKNVNGYVNPKLPIVTITITDKKFNKYVFRVKHEQVLKLKHLKYDYLVRVEKNKPIKFNCNVAGINSGMICSLSELEKRING